MHIDLILERLVISVHPVGCLLLLLSKINLIANAEGKALMITCMHVHYCYYNVQPSPHITMVQTLLSAQVDAKTWLLTELAEIAIAPYYDSPFLYYRLRAYLFTIKVG
jgi:hypothetical protein